MQKQGVPEDQFPPKLVGFTPEDFGNERVARKGLERLKWELERYEPFALGGLQWPHAAGESGLSRRCACRRIA